VGAVSYERGTPVLPTAGPVDYPIPGDSRDAFEVRWVHAVHSALIFSARPVGARGCPQEHAPVGARGCLRPAGCLVQGYLAHKKLPPPRSLQ